LFKSIVVLLFTFTSNRHSIHNTHLFQKQFAISLDVKACISV